METEPGIRDMMYGAGAVTAALSLLVLGSTPILDISPVTKAMLFLLAFTGFLLAGYYSTRRQLTWTFYTAAATSYLVFLFHLFTRTGLSPVYLFIITAVTSTVIIAAAYISEKKNLGPSWGSPELYLTLVALLFMVALTADITGPEPNNTLILNDHPKIENDRVDLGKIVIHNDFYLHRRTKIPDYFSCYLDGQALVTEEVKTDARNIIGPKKVVDARLYIPVEREKVPLDFTSYNVTNADSCSSIKKGEIAVIQEKNK